MLCPLSHLQFILITRTLNLVIFVLCDNKLRISVLCYFSPPLSVHDRYTSHACLGLDIRLVTVDMLLELQKSRSELDLGLQEILGIKVVSGGVARVLFNVQADGGTG